MALNDIKIKNSKPQNMPYKISDGDGLSQLVNPNGSSSLPRFSSFVLESYAMLNGWS